MINHTSENTLLLKQTLMQLSKITDQPFHLEGETLLLPDNKTRLMLLIRKNASQTPDGVLIQQLSLNPPASISNQILIADYINPAQAERLQQAGIQYADSQGNAFIKQPNCFILIRGRKKPDKTTSPASGHAFNTAGMQLIFLLLKDPNLLQATYREMAQRAGIALGSVTAIIKDLGQQGYLMLQGNGRNQKRQLLQKDALLKTWLIHYPRQLQMKCPHLLLTSDDPKWHQHLQMEKLQALWGGEFAAAHYTDGFLKPQNALLYINEEQHPVLIHQARLRKPRAGEAPNRLILLSSQFLDIRELQGKEQGMADPLLVYAELVTSAEPRNLEAAQRLYEKYLS
jgi:hypothetical protein